MESAAQFYFKLILQINIKQAAPPCENYLSSNICNVFTCSQLPSWLDFEFVLFLWDTSFFL